MTIIEKDAPISLSEVWTNYCRIDCGRNTNPGLPPKELAEIMLNRDGEIPWTVSDECEVYMARKSVEESRNEGCLCIGCLEKRIGRRFKPKDFPDHPFNYMPGTHGCLIGEVIR